MRVKIVLKKYTLPVIEDDRKIIKILTSDGKRIGVDMNMLANGSKYIQRILELKDFADRTKIFIPNVSSSQWNHLLELLSYGETKVDRTELEDFLGIAYKLKMKGMKRYKENLKQNCKEVETIIDDTLSMMFQDFDL